MVVSHAQRETAEAAVARHFPGVYFVTLAAAAGFLGFAVQTARNKLCQGVLPFKTIEQGGRRFVPSTELARVIAERLAEAGIEPDTPQQARRQQEKPAKGRRRREGVASCDTSAGGVA